MLSYFRTACRSLRRAPALAATSAVTLLIGGVGCLAPRATPAEPAAMRLSVAPTIAHPGETVMVTIEFRNAGRTAVSVPKEHELYLCYRSDSDSQFTLASKHDFSPDPRLRPGESIVYRKTLDVPRAYGRVEIFIDERDDATAVLEVLPLGWETRARPRELVPAETLLGSEASASWVPAEAELRAVEKAIWYLWQHPDDRLGLEPRMAFPAEFAAEQLFEYFIQYSGAVVSGQRRIVGRALHHSVVKHPDLQKDDPGTATFGFTYDCENQRLLEVTFGIPVWRPNSPNWFTGWTP
jgi:hypothetical protein